ncbi:MAG: hypothetical protein COA73_05925 [Candidatus Hydrogenedentota bacterium]|nr:MAG: hypothetical protein COA73_05925 [Candidatus Hydrogenedentota bacterium]
MGCIKLLLFQPLQKYSRTGLFRRKFKRITRGSQNMLRFSPLKKITHTACIAGLITAAQMSFAVEAGPTNISAKGSAVTGSGMTAVSSLRLADKLYFDADIWTGHSGKKDADTIAIRDGRIIGVGTMASLAELTGPSTNKIDLDGAFVVPGFIDNHVHFLDGGASLNRVRLRTAKSQQQVADTIKAFATNTPKGEWILGGEWDHESWGGQLPTKEWIDAVSPDHPVMVFRLDGHMVLANSLALKIAGIDRDTKAPKGGIIVRDTQGNPAGVLKDTAIALMIKFIPKATAEQLDKMLEWASLEALKNGDIAGAGLDVYTSEPFEDNPFMGLDNIVTTPHLAASTDEAQTVVAVDVAQQMIDYLDNGIINNAVNVPSLDKETREKLGPLISLAGKLGRFQSLYIEGRPSSIEIEYSGDIGIADTYAITTAVIIGFLEPKVESVNQVSAPSQLAERGISSSEIRVPGDTSFGFQIKVTVTTDKETSQIAGTLYDNTDPRICSIGGTRMDAVPDGWMVVSINEDKPLVLGRLTSVIGEAKVNIANLTLGRDEEGGCALTLINLDSPLDEDALNQLRGLEHVQQIRQVQL